MKYSGIVGGIALRVKLIGFLRGNKKTIGKIGLLEEIAARPPVQLRRQVMTEQLNARDWYEHCATGKIADITGFVSRSRNQHTTTYRFADGTRLCVHHTQNRMEWRDHHNFGMADRPLHSYN